MSSRLSFIGFIAMASILSGCATIIEGSSQTILINSPKKIPTRCIVSNDRGQWHVQAPGYVTVLRSSSDLVIHCDETSTQMRAGVEPASINNIIFGFASIIGAGIDAATGALYTYVSQIDNHYQSTCKASVDHSETSKTGQTKSITAKAQPTEFYTPFSLFEQPELRLYKKGNTIALRYVKNEQQ